MTIGQSRVAIVTGGGRGIGSAISRRLAADGHAVVINYTSSATQAEALAAELNAAGHTAMAVQADVSKPDEVAAMTAQTIEAFGPPTILVNNAGISDASSLIRLTPERWNRVVDVNLNGAFYCTNSVLPSMYEQGWGRVIFMGSPSGGRDMTAGVGPYAAAKAGLVALGKSLALEVFHRGITVNTVVPGFVETDMTTSAGPDAIKALEALWPKIPAESVASMIGYLTSEEASHVSGEDIAVWAAGPPVHRPKR